MRIAAPNVIEIFGKRSLVRTVKRRSHRRPSISVRVFAIRYPRTASVYDRRVVKVVSTGAVDAPQGGAVLVDRVYAALMTEDDPSAVRRPYRSGGETYRVNLPILCGRRSANIPYRDVEEGNQRHKPNYGCGNPQPLVALFLSVSQSVRLDHRVGCGLTVDKSPYPSTIPPSQRSASFGAIRLRRA